MSRHNKIRRTRRQAARPAASAPVRHDIDNPDLAALMAISRCKGLVRFGDELVFVVEPKEPIADHMAFDAEVCRAGIPAFVRPRALDDVPAELGDAIGPPASHMVVTELAPGIRTREPVSLHMTHELN